MFVPIDVALIIQLWPIIKLSSLSILNSWQQRMGVSDQKLLRISVTYPLPLGNDHPSQKYQDFLLQHQLKYILAAYIRKRSPASPISK